MLHNDFQELSYFSESSAQETKWNMAGSLSQPMSLGTSLKQMFHNVTGKGLQIFSDQISPETIFFTKTQDVP